jgi:flavodoxin
MERVRFIDHKGKKILHLDFAGCKADEVIPVIEQARTTIAAQPPKSVYTLTDVTDTRYNTEISDAMKEFVAHNKPYVAAAAVVGVTGLKQIILNAVMKFSGRRLHAFDSLAEAKDWLAGQ